ncbi:MAG: RNA-binding protein [Gammaproteobacteria bacterium]
MKLLVRNLAHRTTASDLRELFEDYGSIQSCTIVMDKVSNESKGFGFVEMPRPGEAKAAMKNLNGREVDGRIIRVKKAEDVKTGSPGAAQEPHA